MDNLTVALLQLNGGVRGLAIVQAAAGVTPGEARLADEARKLFFFFLFEWGAPRWPNGKFNKI